MEFSGRISRVERDLLSKDYLITFSTKELPNSVQSLNREDYLSIKAVKKRKKRSLDSNSYAWALISQIASVIQSTKEEVYMQMLQRYGQPQLDEEGQAVLITVLSKIDITKYDIYAKRISGGVLNGKHYTSYMVLRGSSTYDTKEMSLFIDGVVSDAKELGIDTIPKIELEKMKAKWHL